MPVNAARRNAPHSNAAADSQKRDAGKVDLLKVNRALWLIHQSALFVYFENLTFAASFLQ
jgi:hypothetical protein